MEAVMKRAKKYIRNKPSVAVSVPTALCCGTLLGDLINAFKSCDAALQQVTSALSMTNCFEAVLLLVIMIVLRKENK
jgi:hypothetical protein